MSGLTTSLRTSESRQLGSRCRLAWVGFLLALALLVLPGAASQGPCSEEQDDFQCDDCPTHVTCSFPPPTQADPWGCWQIFDWECQIVSGGSSNPELSHAALIPTGPYRGMVLLWHNQGPGTNNDTTRTFLFDPANPERLLVNQQVLQSNLFCSNASWSSTGSLIVVGGGRQSNPYLAPVETYSFFPSLLSPPNPFQTPPCTAKLVKGNPWIKLDDMSLLRYYPTLITLLKGAIYSTLPGVSLSGGAAFVLGGEWDGTSMVHGHGSDWLQILDPQTGDWSHTFRAEQDGIACDTNPNTPEPPCPGVEEIYTLEHDASEPSPNPIFEYYPRAIQLATTDPSDDSTRKNLFVANDTETGTETGCSTDNPPTCNEPGSSWILKMPYDGAQFPWELWTGPFDDLTGNGPTERFYTPVVVRHDEFTRNRVIALGDQYVDSVASDNDIRRDVVELKPAVGIPDPSQAVWEKKYDLITPRYFCNAVILPTGRILIIGGAWDLCIDCEGPDRIAIPACCPELYEPGDPLGGVNPTSWLMAARPNYPANGTFDYPRLYHNVALMLQDGRVYNAGGKNATRCDPGSQAAYPESSYTGDVFAPPYHHDPTRPSVVTVSPIEPIFGEAMTVTVSYPDGYDEEREIDRFVLLRPGAVTHHFDSDQRYIELAFVEQAPPNGNEHTFTVYAPADDLGPPGYYLLFATRPTGDAPPHDRVPSVLGVFLRLQ